MIPAEHHAAASTKEDRAETELIGIARFKFREGNREEYLRLSAQANAIVEARTRAPSNTTCSSRTSARS